LSEGILDLVSLFPVVAFTDDYVVVVVVVVDYVVVVDVVHDVHDACCS